jgi:hypothetical protein
MTRKVKEFKNDMTFQIPDTTPLLEGRNNPKETYNPILKPYYRRRSKLNYESNIGSERKDDSNIDVTSTLGSPKVKPFPGDFSYMYQNQIYR